jgi:Rrf2 family protein
VPARSARDRLTPRALVPNSATGDPQGVRITTWAEYGLICALNLARRAGDGPVTGRAVAASESLPVDYVEQILLRLRRAGIVESIRGARGGYFLAKSPRDITVRDVVAASELQTFDMHCVSNPLDEHRCADSTSCSIRPVWVLLQSRIDEVLDGIRLADLLANEETVRVRVKLDAPPELAGRILPVLTVG